MNNTYYHKYLKYKEKYISLQKQLGGSPLNVFENSISNGVDNCAAYIFSIGDGGVIYFGCVRKVHDGGRITDGRISGAAGTNEKYWGKWTSPGGGLRKDGKDRIRLLRAVVDEINDETGSMFDSTRVLLRWKGRPTGAEELICHLAEKVGTSAIFLFEMPNILFFRVFPKEGRADESLVKSSKGEVDAVQSFSTDQIKDLQHRENLARNNYFISYFINTFNRSIRPKMYDLNPHYAKKWRPEPDIPCIPDIIKRDPPPTEFLHGPWNSR